MRILRDVVSLIACEDTRQTQKLLNHFEIRKPLLSYHEGNEASRTAQILAALERNESIAVVSDAGTPLVSDPGYRITKAAIEKGFAVVPIPGPAACIAALTASGLPTDEFRFLGFFPAKSAARRKAIEALRDETATCLIYESPHRILDCLADVAELLPSAPLAVARELTKIHEEFLRGTAAEILSQLQSRPAVKGEFTIVVGAAPQALAQPVANPAGEVKQLEESGLSRMEAIKSAAKKLGVPKREMYRLLMLQPGPSTEQDAEAAEDSNSPDRHRD